MPRSQIKRAMDDFFQLRRFKDFRHRPDAVRFLDILHKQSQIRRAPDGSFFGNAESAFHTLERHRAVTGRTSGGDRMAPARRRVELCAAIRLPSSHRGVVVRFMLSFAFNHSSKTDFSFDSLRILNNASQKERGRDPKEVATPLLMKKIEQILWRYKCHLHLELMNYNEVRYQYALLQYNNRVANEYVRRPERIYKINPNRRFDSHRKVLGQ